jgi:hypothetical protein
MNRKIILLGFLLLIGCDWKQTSILFEDEPAGESEDISNDPMFDPMPEGIDPETGGSYVPVAWNTPQDADLPCNDGSGSCTSINWVNLIPDPNGPIWGYFSQNINSGSIPPPKLPLNNDPGTQDLSKIFDRYAPSWLLDGVFGTQNGPQIPLSLPPSMVDIEVPALPEISMPIAPSVPTDPADGLIAAFAAGTRTLEAQSEALRAAAEKALKDVQNTLNAKNVDLARQVSHEIGKQAVDNRNEMLKQLDDLKKRRDSAGTSALQKIPSIDKPVPRSTFNTSAESVEGIAVRRAQRYVDYGRRTVESAPETNEGRAVAKQLIANSQEVLNSADYNYSKGAVSSGDAGLKLAYSLADAAIALAPVAALAFGPAGVVAAIGLEALSLAKNWYEYKSGKSIWTGQALSPFQRDMALVNVGFAFVPAATQLVGLGTSALRSAINTGKSLTAPQIAALPSAEKFAAGFQKLPPNLQPQRVIAGSSDTLAIVGRSMGNPSEGLVGVNDVAKALQAEGFQVKTFTPSKSALDDLGIRGAKYSDGRVPYDKVSETLMYQENKIWAEDLLQDGLTIIDIGNPNQLATPSAFYDMEVEVLWNMFRMK